MKKERKAYIESCKISELTEVTLGGFRQKILIEAHTEGLPVLLFLHGGPGFPAPFCAGARGLFPEITKKFTAVYWDQLGCGINNYKLNDGFNLARFAEMAAELVRYLKERFPEAPLYLFGISYGSALAAYVAEKVPQLIAGAVTAGQIVLPPMLSREAFAAVAASSAPIKTKRKIAALFGKELDLKEIALLSKTMRKYTNAYGIQDKSSPTENPFREIFASKDYRLRDKIACFRNGYRFCGELLKVLGRIDLRKTLAGVRIPYHIFGGELDAVTAVRESLEVAETAINPLLKVTVLKGEGHVPTARACAQIIDELERINV